MRKIGDFEIHLITVDDSDLLLDDTPLPEEEEAKKTEQTRRNLKFRKDLMNLSVKYRTPEGELVPYGRAPLAKALPLTAELFDAALEDNGFR